MLITDYSFRHFAKVLKRFFTRFSQSFSRKTGGTTIYSDKIFIGDHSGKKLWTGFIIFSILLHITIVYLVYETGCNKKYKSLYQKYRIC